jgi:hydroxymethylpyrimidine pyrophosphatase-like HAD family hydrolase
LRIAAVFSDYDGTLAPSGVERGLSRIPGTLERELKRVALTIPFIIVTSKDFDFVFPRTSFARAWACVSGLEIRLSTGRTICRPGLVNVDQAYRRFIPEKAKFEYLEAKRDSAGRLLGFSIEWKPEVKPPTDIVEAAFALRDSGLFVEQNELYPFIDVFAGSPDKGKAIRDLKKILRINDGVMFIGDSRADNRAFREADLAIGVLHGQPMEELECEFTVDYKNLAGFVAALVESNMEFMPSLPHVSRRDKE